VGGPHGMQHRGAGRVPQRRAYRKVRALDFAAWTGT